MYVIKRKQSMWLCTSPRETFEVEAVSLRLQGEFKDFKVFEQRLNAWEHIDAGVIEVYKCSVSIKCEDCTKYKSCEILQAVKETAQAQADWSKWVYENGGYTL